MNITTMMACAIDQIFQRQLKQEEEIGKISQILSEKNNEMYNLAEKPTKDDKEYESMDELQETGENGKE